MTVSNLLRCLLFVALLLSVGAPDALAQGSGRIRGLVVDDETDEPIAGATVRAELPDADRNVAPVEATSDENGRFSVFGLVSGQWMTTATIEGFGSESSFITVTQGTTPPVTFYLVRTRGALELALGDEAFEGLDAAQLQADLATADAAYNAQQWDAAISGYTALLEALPQLGDLHMQLGDAYRAKGSYEEALAEYSSVLVDDPENA